MAGLARLPWPASWRSTVWIRPIVAATLLLALLTACGGATEVTPAPVTFTRVSAGDQYSLALDGAGQAWAWGDAEAGSLGTGGLDEHLTPARVAMPSGVTFTAVAGGAGHSLALDQLGRAWAWGSFGRGQLGTGSTSDQPAPAPVRMPPNVRFIAISAGYQHSLALDADGRAWAWGSGGGGRLGNGSEGDAAEPVAVVMPAGVAFTAVDAGAAHSLALGADGRAWAWGNGFFGNLGNGDTADQLTPVPVDMPDGVTFTAVSAGDAYSLALDGDGDAWAWGYRGPGLLGNDGVDEQLAPGRVSMPPGVAFRALHASFDTALALDASGRGWTWGSGALGQLGNGTTDPEQPTPVAVTMPEGVTFETIAGGGPSSVHFLAIDRDGRAWAWGDGERGQLGDGGTSAAVTTPRRVTMPHAGD
jgi:alpha-tubulin suppressor-like RCC1 family protein